MKVANAAFMDLLPYCADSQDLEYGGQSTISLLSQESSTQHTARTLGRCWMNGWELHAYQHVCQSEKQSLVLVEILLYSYYS